MVDASAASAAATVTESGVYPTALARGAAGAPASAAGMRGGGVDSAGWGEGDSGSARRCLPHGSDGLDNGA